MGILNLTPDSFSDGGEHEGPAAALVRARELVAAGAEVLDLGAESSRPGADPISPDVERARLLPVLEALVAADLPVALSVDTRRAELAHEALACGAAMINDISGQVTPAMMDAVRTFDASYVAMHNRGTFASMHHDHVYDDVVTDVHKELRAQHRLLLEGGLLAEQVWLDIGLGFAKTSEQNWQLCRSLSRLTDMGSPLLLGASRKRFLASAAVNEANANDWAARDRATAALCALGVAAGVQLVRVHNVRACREAVAVGEQVR